MDFLWTGQTEFELEPAGPKQDTDEAQPQHPPQPRDPREEPFGGEATPWLESAMPYDSAVPYEPSEPYQPSLTSEEKPAGSEAEPAADGQQQDAEEAPQHQPQPRDPRVLRRRQRTRQLQRGFWTEVQHEGTIDLLEATLDYVRQEGSAQWVKINVDSDLGKSWRELEGASAEVRLILASMSARRLKKPQPHLGPAEVPLRKSYVLLSGHEALSTDFEQWFNLSPAAQVRPLIAQGRLLYVAIFATELGSGALEEDPGEDGARGARLDERRAQKWQALPRELKLAIKRVHVNLGHASMPTMLRAMRIAKASEVAIKACRLFRCPECPRLQEPRRPRPSKLPLTDEFNIMVGIDVFQAKDSQGEQWSFLNILCQGTTFQVVSLLGDTFANPTSAAVLEALNSSWFSWAGYPERGVMSDRAKYFLADVAEDLAAHGCYVEPASRASPWQLGAVERHGAIWKSTFQKIVWSNQVAGREEILMTTSATNQAKNAMSRKGGFSPAQWVLGRDIRLPASLADDTEVARIGAQALADTPGTKFHRKAQLRFAAREAFARSSNDAVLRRAELRKVRPSRGPFHVGTYVFYYDASAKEPGPNCWRGIARVVGKEGSRTVWVSHRGILLACSPEHLAKADDSEVQQWMAVTDEVELMDVMPPSGGTGFIDLRRAPVPEAQPEAEGEEAPAEQQQQQVEEQPERAPPRAQGDSDLSSSSLSAARMRWESERDASRARRSSEFFGQQERRRKERRLAAAGTPAVSSAQGPARPTAAETPVASADDFDPDLMSEVDWDPEVNDYHTSLRRQLSPMVEDAEGEAIEREAKRQRAIEPGERANFASEGCDAYMAATSPSYLSNKALDRYYKHEAAYLTSGVNVSEFMFGVRRNVFQDKYEALASTDGGNNNGGVKKKGRKELKLSEISDEHRQLFVGKGGADEKEWSAWKMKEACEILSAAESRRVRKEKPELIVPTRWGANQQERRPRRQGLLGKEPAGGPRFQGQVPWVLPEGRANSLSGGREHMPSSLLLLQVYPHRQGHQECLLFGQKCWARDLLGASQGRFAWPGARETTQSQEGHLWLC